MLVELYDATPQHQDNFVKLVQEGYYDGLLFHRVIENFMIQGGDPKSKDAPAGQALGSGGPGYTIPAEFVDSLVHIKGAIAAARTGDAVNPQKRSSGSQFYIVHGRKVTEQDLAQLEAQKGFRYTTRQKEAYLEHGGTPFLDRDYTVFGQVVEGFEVLDKLAAVPTDPRDRPKEDLKMKIRLIR
jgi:peptidyl-prolyl cis-trans isomerase B (cyclophilin B)